MKKNNGVMIAISRRYPLSILRFFMTIQVFNLSFVVLTNIFMIVTGSFLCLWLGKQCVYYYDFLST